MKEPIWDFQMIQNKGHSNAKGQKLFVPTLEGNK